LVFGSPYPNHAFTPWIQSRAAFLRDPVLSCLEGKIVRVVGKIEIYKLKPEIRVSSRSQILDG
jgi:DNA/RNA endonuclease YhcR with UshA esterase domain